MKFKDFYSFDIVRDNELNPEIELFRPPLMVGEARLLKVGFLKIEDGFVKTTVLGRAVYPFWKRAWRVWNWFTDQ